MVKKFIESAKSIDKKILSIMFYGFKVSFVFLISSFIVSLFYILNPISHILFDSGIILFKTGLTFIIMFFISAFAIDKIKKELV